MTGDIISEDRIYLASESRSFSNQKLYYREKKMMGPKYKLCKDDYHQGLY